MGTAGIHHRHGSSLGARGNVFRKKHFVVFRFFEGDFFGSGSALTTFMYLLRLLIEDPNRKSCLLRTQIGSIFR